MKRYNRFDVATELSYSCAPGPYTVTFAGWKFGGLSIVEVEDGLSIEELKSYFRGLPVCSLCLGLWANNRNSLNASTPIKELLSVLKYS